MFSKNTLLMTKVSECVWRWMRTVKFGQNNIGENIVRENLCRWFQYNPFVSYNVIIRYQNKLGFCQILSLNVCGAFRLRILRSGNPLDGRYISRDCAKINSLPQRCRGLLQRTAVRGAFRCAVESSLNFCELFSDSVVSCSDCLSVFWNFYLFIRAAKTARFVLGEYY